VDDAYKSRHNAFKSVMGCDCVVVVVVVVVVSYGVGTLVGKRIESIRVSP
jgi:hypothetical protein